MKTPTTKVSWVKCSERLPDVATYGPYPRVLVATSHNGHPDWGYGIRLAELRFINGDPSRPTWLSADKSLAPVETYAFGVTYWADAPEPPDSEGLTC